MAFNAHNESVKRWRKNHPDYQKKQQKEYYKKNREKILLQIKQRQQQIENGAHNYHKISKGCWCPLWVD